MILNRMRSLYRDCRATVAVEFALALPILCAMIFALYEVAAGIITYLKVDDVAYTVSDLIGQTLPNPGGVGNTDFDNLYLAGQLIMQPNTGTPLGLAIASVTFDGKGQNPTVAWQVERGGAKAMTNAASLVTSLGTPNGSVIVVQATYSYTSLLNFFITTPITVSSQVFAQPRSVTQVACPPSGSSETCS